MKFYRGLSGIAVVLFLIGAYDAWRDLSYLPAALLVFAAILFLIFIVITNDFVEKDRIFEAAKSFGRGDLSLEDFGSETKDILGS
jgi:UDP-N-acetylmuramyl pentapeptide phosphotransferase/UDP-N-acetylglucosamine-1-phosphate transferase